jgi:hypothetical protein
MNGESGGEYTFVCPGCRERLAVDGPMRETLIRKGCVVCGSTVTGAAFGSVRCEGS